VAEKTAINIKTYTEDIKWMEANLDYESQKNGDLNCEVAQLKQDIFAAKAQLKTELSTAQVVARKTVDLEVSISQEGDTARAAPAEKEPRHEEEEEDAGSAEEAGWGGQRSPRKSSWFRKLLPSTDDDVSSRLIMIT